MNKIKVFFGHETSDGAIHKTLEEAKAHQLRVFFRDDPKGEEFEGPIGDVCRKMVANAAAVIDILSDKPSKPKRKKRSDAGKKREKPA